MLFLIVSAKKGDEMQKKEQNNRNTATAQQISQFWDIFKHGHNYIEAPNPYYDVAKKAIREDVEDKIKPDWRTERHIYLRKKVLESRFHDPSELIGLSFDSRTNYIILDTDAFSQYLPSHAEQKFKEILGWLEDIGLVCPQHVQSSFSTGLHTYFFFPEYVNTFNAACAVEGRLKEMGVDLKGGQMEIFPNTKAYKEKVEDSFYKGIRLPLQPMTGSMMLDDDFNPIGADMDEFVRRAQFSANKQDMTLFKAACKKYGLRVRLERCGRNRRSLKKFIKDLKVHLTAPFTGRGQTNEILLGIGAYGVVAKRLDEEVGIEPLAKYIKEKITNLKGYEQYCGHQHEIDKRCREVAKSCQEYYWAAGKERKRDRKPFLDNFNKVMEGVSNGTEAKKIKATQKIEYAVKQANQDIINGLRELPKNLTDYGYLLISYSKERFGEGIGRGTLYHDRNKPLWQKAFAVLVATVQVATSQPAEAAIAPELEITKPIVEVVEIIEPIAIEKVATKPPSKTATPVENTGKFKCLPKIQKSESLQPAENKESSSVVLYGGFGGAADRAQRDVVALNLEMRSQLEQKIKQNSDKNKKQQQLELISNPDTHQPAAKSQQSISKTYPSTDALHPEKPPESESDPLETYYEEFYDRHPHLKAHEVVKESPEYQNTFKASMARIRGNLDAVRNKLKSKHGDHSSFP